MSTGKKHPQLELIVTDAAFVLSKNPESRVIAFATLTFNDALKVKKFRLIEGANGRFLGYPSEKGESDRYYPWVTPIDEDVRQKIQEGVFERFDLWVKSGSPEESGVGPE